MDAQLQNQRNNEEPKIGVNTALAESFGIVQYHIIDSTKPSHEKALKLLTESKNYTRLPGLLAKPALTGAF